MTYPLEIHVTAPDDTNRAVVVRAVRLACIEYANTWGDHSAVSYSLDAAQVVPYVADPDDTPETPKRHVWVVFIPGD